jgi:hypothetical protein
LLSFADRADLARTAAEQTTSVATYVAQGTGKSEDWIIEGGSKSELRMVFLNLLPSSVKSAKRRQIQEQMISEATTNSKETYR